MTVQKLIEQYQSKVTECDSDIERATAGRKQAKGEWDFNIHNDELQAAKIRRQAYFQFTKDLEDLEVAK